MTDSPFIFADIVAALEEIKISPKDDGPCLRQPEKIVTRRPHRISLDDSVFSSPRLSSISLTSREAAGELVANRRSRRSVPAGEVVEGLRGVASPEVWEASAEEQAAVLVTRLPRAKRLSGNSCGGLESLRLPPTSSYESAKALLPDYTREFLPPPVSLESVEKSILREKQLSAIEKTRVSVGLVVQGQECDKRRLEEAANRVKVWRDSPCAEPASAPAAPGKDPYTCALEKIRNAVKQVETEEAARLAEIARQEAARLAEEERIRKKAEEERKAAAEATRKAEEARKEKEAAAKKAEEECRKAEAERKAAADAEAARSAAAAPVVQPTAASTGSPQGAASPAAGKSPVAAIEELHTKNAVETTLAMVAYQEGILARIQQSTDPKVKDFRVKISMEMRKNLNRAATTKSLLLRGAESIAKALQETKSFSLPSLPPSENFRFALHSMSTMLLTFCEPDQPISRNPRNTWGYATVAATIGVHFPEFKDIFKAVMFTGCTYAVPYYRKKSSGTPVIRRTTETDEAFYTRMASCVRLYLATLVCLGDFDSLWTWVTRLMNLGPRMVTPFLLQAFLETASHSCYNTFGNQYTKLLRRIHNNFLSKLREVRERARAQGGNAEEVGANVEVSIHAVQQAVESALLAISRGGGIPVPDGYEMPDETAEIREV